MVGNSEREVHAARSGDAHSSLEELSEGEGFQEGKMKDLVDQLYRCRWELPKIETTQEAIIRADEKDAEEEARAEAIYRATLLPSADERFRIAVRRCRRKRS